MEQNLILDLIREKSSKRSTIGKLYINNIFECYTLEDVERKEKIKNETAIPKGTYTVIITKSNRFKRDLPLLLNVLNFEGIRIHSGNTNHDTEGCILVGKTRGVDIVNKSKIAFNSLFSKLQIAYKNKQKIIINIK